MKNPLTPQCAKSEKETVDLETGECAVLVRDNTSESERLIRYCN